MVRVEGVGWYGLAVGIRVLWIRAVQCGWCARTRERQLRGLADAHVQVAIGRGCAYGRCMATKAETNLLIGALILIGGLGTAAIAIAAERERRRLTFPCPNPDCQQPVLVDSPACGHCGRALVWPS